MKEMGMTGLALVMMVIIMMSTGSQVVMMVWIMELKEIMKRGMIGEEGYVLSGCRGANGKPMWGAVENLCICAPGAKLASPSAASSRPMGMAAQRNRVFALLHMVSLGKLASVP